MRLSSDETDPGYDTWDELGESRHQLKIFLDGVEQKHVSMVDDEKGVIRRCKLNADGELYAVGNEIATETVSGVVRIELPEVVA